MLANPTLREQADRYLEEHHDEFLAVVPDLVRVFPIDQEQGTISAQVRGLLSVARSATRFVDVEDFVKNQMGKEFSKKKADRWEPRWCAVGTTLLDQLGRLRAVEVHAADGEAGRLQFRLMLVRGWVRAIVSEYLYRQARATVQGGSRR
jgi:hypothetical protein